MFAEKFDALMNIAAVSNTKLGKAINMDSSHIGRLRSGARSLPKNPDFIRQICNYLCEHIVRDYQVAALRNLTGFDIRLETSQEELASCLQIWLLENKEGEDVGRLFSGGGRIATVMRDVSQSAKTENVMPYYYGNAGKRKAVEKFFLMILEEEEPQTLYLFSNENMSWLYEDEAFIRTWESLFKQVIGRGNRIQVIHTVNRDMNELVEAVIKWIPIYATGLIHPYYYPRLSDGIFRKTMFLAQNTSGVISSSIQENTKDTLNLFITDKVALAALVKEYESYLSLCSPLMKIYDRRECDKIWMNFEKLLRHHGDSIMSHPVPIFFTMPKKVFQEIYSETGNQVFYDLWNTLHPVFLEHIKEQGLTKFVLSVEAIRKKENITIPFSDLIFGKEVCYHKEQYMEHMDYLRELSERENQFALIEEERLLFSEFMYMKDRLSVIFGTMSTVFVFDEANMVNAFWEYFSIFMRQ